MLRGHTLKRRSSSLTGNMCHLCSKLAITALILLSAFGVDAQEATSSNRAENTMNPAAVPFSMERLLKALEPIKSGLVPQQMLIRDIQKRGLSFNPTQEDLDKIRSSGGSKRLLDAIRGAPQFLPPPPPPPPAPKPLPPKDGQLVISCTPVDCSVNIDDHASGSTQSGQLAGVMHPVGTAVVRVAAPGYEPEPKEISRDVRENQRSHFDFTLKPTRATLEKVGAARFERMLEALGGEKGLKESGFVRANGSITVDGRGKQVPWSSSILIKAPDKAKFSVARGGQKYEIAFTPEGYQWSRAPKRPELQDLQDLEDVLRLLREYQLPALVERLRRSGRKPVAPTVNSAPSEATALRIEGTPESYVVTLDSASRPVEIKLESTGLNSGLRIIFSDYVVQGGGVYPKETQIVLPTTPPRGLQARYENVQLSPSGVKDVDFGIKKGVSLLERQ